MAAHRSLANPADMDDEFAMLHPPEQQAEEYGHQDAIHMSSLPTVRHTGFTQRMAVNLLTAR